MKAVLNIPVSADDGEVRVDRWFKRHFPKLTQGQIEKLLRTGQVRVDGARVKAADRLQSGQIVRVPPLPDAPPPRSSSGLSLKDEEFIRDLVIYKDDDVIVLNKPAGLAVQGGTKTLRHVDGMLPGLKFEREDKPKLVHRLDRDTSGCLVLARHPRAAAHLGDMFRSREGDKIYWAVVAGTPRPNHGEIRGWMRKAPGAVDADREMVQRCLQQDEGAVHAITQYSVVSDAGGKAAWMALKPVTGRTHQLRFHMSEIGHAIIGDPKYKSDREEPGGLSKKLHLHARAIRLPHPTKGTLKAEAPLPSHMQAAFEHLGFNAKDAKNPFEPFEA
ncbi:MAG: RluA family pseudouridine synthase [Caulobacterales bacterium]